MRYFFPVSSIPELPLSMRCGHLFFTSLLVASLFVSSSLSSQSPEECIGVTKAKIEEKFGTPVKCSKDSDGVKCFGDQQEPIRVQFGSSDVVTSIEISTLCNGLNSLKKVLNEIVPKNARGKFLKESPKSDYSSCELTVEEEYECLRIRYFQELCTGCAPASIKVIWK